MCRSCSSSCIVDRYSGRSGSSLSIGRSPVVMYVMNLYHLSHTGVYTMSERSVVESQLKKKEAEVLLLEDKLKVARVYIKALQDVLKEIQRDPSSGEGDAEVALRRGSAVARARDVILARGSPIHVDDLILALGKEVTRESKASLTGSLAAYVRRGEIFTRPAPSTFGLIELEQFEVQSKTEEPPPGFGQPKEHDDDEIPF